MRKDHRSDPGDKLESLLHAWRHESLLPPERGEQIRRAILREACAVTNESTPFHPRWWMELAGMVPGFSDISHTLPVGFWNVGGSGSAFGVQTPDPAPCKR